jgi:localization factor PodJL
MARAYSETPPSDPGQRPEQGEWQALRGELLALLDQVEGQVTRTARVPASTSGLAERMRDLRQPPPQPRQPAMADPQPQRRVIDPPRQPAPRVSPPSADPAEGLRSAIQQIRARHMPAAPARASAQAQSAPVRIPSQEHVRQDASRHEPVRLEAMIEAVNAFSSRLERLEAEIRTQARSGGNVREISEQMAQLTGVVEMLAGAVGESGQVRRLEAQIAGLARVFADGPQVDLSALTRRLDDLAEHVGQLADFQIAAVDRAEQTQRTDPALTDGISAIETSLRNVYDRIDALERSSSAPSPELERIIADMATIAAAIEAGPPEPARLVALVEDLGERIGGFEARDWSIAGLKDDISGLRETVLTATEPRFAVLESRLATIGDRLDDGFSAERTDPGIAQLEAQVRQLVHRMDQTGEQLSGLARLHAEADERNEMPDFDALAEILAMRVETAGSEAGVRTSESLKRIEARIAELASASAAAPHQDASFAGMQRGIDEVNSRLERLEASLAGMVFAEPSRSAPEPHRSIGERFSDLESSVRDDDDEQPEASWPEPRPAAPPVSRPAPARDDIMPDSPAEDRPLVDRSFGDPVRSALAARTGTRKYHPGLGEEPAVLSPDIDESSLPEAPTSATLPAHTPLPFNPATVERPPAPRSSFTAREEDFFAQPAPATPAAPADAGIASAATTSTFIAAARRAAQRQQDARLPDNQPASLIGRAFARLQPAPAQPAAETTAREPAKDATKPAGTAPVSRSPAVATPTPAVAADANEPRLLAGDKPSPADRQAEKRAARDAKAAEKQAARDAARSAREAQAGDRQAKQAQEVSRRAQAATLSYPPADAEEEPAESFLTRHRRPILLAAAVVALSFLTLNLVGQRLGGGQQQPGPVPPMSSEPVPEVPADAVPPRTGALTAPRVIPLIDSLATGSVDPAAARGFAKSGVAPAMPMSFAPAGAPTSAGTAAEKAELIAARFDASAPLPAAAAPAPLVAAPVAAPAREALFEMPPDAIGPLALRQAAASGDARAQFEVAAILTEGRVLPEDLAAAATWYSRSAMQGFAPAQYRLGSLFEHGRGVEKDIEQARLWYQRAAEAGNRMSMHNLAAVYAGGELGTQDFSSAAEWFEKAAHRGLNDSQFNLGMLYARGLGVSQDFEQSYRWFGLAARNGDADAAKARDDVARSLDAEAVSRISAELAQWTAQPFDLAANFAPIGTWTADFDPGLTVYNRDLVRSVQAALNRLGFDVGTPDGLPGPRTADAIKAFERATGMSESGAVNPRLLAVLGSQPV